MLTPAILDDAATLLNACRARGVVLATAESCTGGLIAAALTSVAGSSDVVDRGFVTYSNEAKTELVGVQPGLIEAHGAVSAEVAASMAEGALARSRAAIAVSVTGVAGPGGGTAEKPVGLVFLHAAGPQGELTLRLDFPGDRDTIRGRATVAALHLVRRLATKL